jgi:Spy/CpxP family protein refolding chaperone
MEKTVTKDKTTIKLLVAALLIITGLGWTFYRVNKVRPGAVANNGVTEEFVPPSPEEINKMRYEMYAAANITPEQQKQLEELQKKAREMWEQRQAETTGPQRMGPGGPPGGGPFAGPGMMMGRVPRELQSELDKILTSEQQQKVREVMRSRFQQERAKREAKVKAALGETEYQRYLEKRQQRRPAWRGGGPPGGGRPGGGQQNPSSQGSQTNPQNPGGRP